MDFAYAVHTEVGNLCHGAKVNGQIVPLRHALSNGDVVEILTQKGHVPSRDWLSFVHTSRARSKIRHWVHINERGEATEVGRRLLEGEAKQFGRSLKQYRRRQICCAWPANTASGNWRIYSRTLDTENFRHGRF